MDYRAVLKDLIREVVREEMQSSRTTPADIRERAGYSTAEQVAAVVGMTTEQFRRYERGDVNTDNRITAGRLRRIAEALHCTVVEYRAAVRGMKNG